MGPIYGHQWRHFNAEYLDCDLDYREFGIGGVDQLQNVIDWIKKGVGLGAGEILLTSVDREGTRKGFDIPLVQAVTQEVSVPVIASGGMGKPEDMIDAVLEGKADAIAMADILHYDRATLGDIRSAAITAGIEVRDFEYA